MISNRIILIRKIANLYLNVISAPSNCNEVFVSQRRTIENFKAWKSLCCVSRSHIFNPREYFTTREREKERKNSFSTIKTNNRWRIVDVTPNVFQVTPIRRLKHVDSVWEAQLKFSTRQTSVPSRCNGIAKMARVSWRGKNEAAFRFHRFSVKKGRAFNVVRWECKWNNRQCHFPRNLCECVFRSSITTYTGWSVRVNLA